MKEGIEVGLADGRVVNSLGYGRFLGADGSTNGIAIAPLEGTKPSRTTYFIRTAAAPTTNGEFTAASKARRINIAGEQKVPNYKLNKGVVKLRANTYVQLPNGTVELQAAKGQLDAAEISGDVRFWMAATAKKPASAKQTLTIAAAAP